MDMGDSMMMGSAPTDSALNASGVDFSNKTQAAGFLGEILDDTEFQVDGNMYARNFWYGVCTIIATCAFFNITQKMTLKMRMRAAASRSRPASPANIFSTSIASVTAIIREATYVQFTPIHSRLVKVPPAGTITLVVGYLAWVILLEFVDSDVDGGQHFTSLGFRAAWLSVAQVPLLILLAGKNNLIGEVSGIGYERLNVLHRWTARVLLISVTLHMLFLHLAWNAYDLGPLEYATDSCIPTGWAVYAILVWMNISTIAPLCNFSYEFFVVQHIITFVGFIIAAMMHLPSTALYSRVYIYIPIGLYLLDRIIRSSRYMAHNIRPGRATLAPLEGGVTRVTIQSKVVKKWPAGSHVFLSIPKFGIGQSHPATIASNSTTHNRDLIFLLKSHKGFTARLLKSATSSNKDNVEISHLALIDGPYGSSHSDFAAFDTVLLISGSTGTTFTLPILLDLAARAQGQKLPVKRITFLWIVKNTSWVSWIRTELSPAAEKLNAAGIEFDISIHVTCDDDFTTGIDGEGKDDDCECDKSLGPCCCINVSHLSASQVQEIVDEKGTRISKIENSTSQVNVAPRSSTSSSSSTVKSGTRSRVLPYARFYSGRPDVYELLWDMLERAEGETGVAFCGPLGLSSDVRKSVVRCSNERAVHKGSGAQGVYLHAECFGW